MRLSDGTAARAAKRRTGLQRGLAGMTESQIQIAVMAHIRLRAAPGVVAWHCPNGGGRSPAEAGRFRAEGVLAGMPDVQVLHQGRFYALELKTTRGRLSPAQRDCHERLAAAGASVAVAYGLDAALVQLEAWGIIR